MAANNTPQHFQMRGETMDRLETFVAAAFAFAVTMLVISLDDVPSNFSEFLLAVKLVPSFAASFATIAWIWATHANWCRRYGLEDGPTIVLSCLLVFLVLIYVFPLRAMMQGLFAVLSNGYLPSEMRYSNINEVRFMFTFYAIGFWALSVNFFALFRYALYRKERLQLTDAEIYLTQSDAQTWGLVNLVALTSIAFAQWLPDENIGMAGFVYFALFPLLATHSIMRGRTFKQRFL